MTTETVKTNSPASRIKKPYYSIAMEGRIARWYAQNTRNRGDYESTAKKVAGMVAPGSLILEVAPGPGYLSIALAKLGRFQVTGMDISNTFVEIAQEEARKAGVQVNFKQGDVADMPFEDESFDFIICTAAFKNFPQPVQALKEMYRVLKTGGKAIIDDLRPDASRKDIDAEVKKMELSPVNAFLTKWSFHFMLLKTAHPKEELNTFISQTPFKQFEIKQDGIGYEIRLVK